MDTASALGFTGEFTDPSGLLFLRARYYQPELGAFLSRDPFEGFTGQVVSRNGYIYANGSPVNYTDPSGEFAIFAGIAALAGSVLGGAFLGAALGVAFSSVTAALIYDWTMAGNCGCERQQQLAGMDRTRFILEAAAQGALYGAMFGAMIGGGSIFAVASGFIGIRLGIEGILQSGIELLNGFINGEGLNYCAMLELILNIAAVWGGYKAIQHGINTINETPTLWPDRSKGRPGSGPGGGNGPGDGGPDYIVRRHGDMPTPRPPNRQSHHGVPTTWMEDNYLNYNMDDAPAVLMPNNPDHNATRGIMRRWMTQMSQERFNGGPIDWRQISFDEIRTLSQEMFDATNTPANIRQEYWRQFRQYRQSLTPITGE